MSLKIIKSSLQTHLHGANELRVTELSLTYPSILTDDQCEGLVKPAVVAFSMEHCTAEVIQLGGVILKATTNWQLKKKMQLLDGRWKTLDLSLWIYYMY